MTYDPTTDMRTNEQKHADYVAERAIVREMAALAEAMRKARQEGMEKKTITLDSGVVITGFTDGTFIEIGERQEDA